MYELHYDARIHEIGARGDNCGVGARGDNCGVGARGDNCGVGARGNNWSRCPW